MIQQTDLIAEDRFLVEADWTKVDELVNFRGLGAADGLVQESFLRRFSECPGCAAMVSRSGL